MGDGMYIKTLIALCDLCNRLFLVGKDGFRIKRMACLWNLHWNNYNEVSAILKSSTYPGLKTQ